MPILAVAFVLSQRDKLAVYRDGIFRAKFDDVDVDYLAKDAAFIQLRWMDLTDIARRLLSGMAQVVRDLDKTNELVHLEPIDVGRGLVAIYDLLPKWTERTMRLSLNAVNIRNLFKRAHDPNQFLFDDIPGTLGEDVSLANENGLRRVISSVREGLEELVQAYPSMLHRLRDIMLAELQVPNVSPQALAELRERAKNIRQLSGDFRLDAFVGRLTQFDGLDENFEGIASLAANKPPRDWVDPDLDHAAIELADMAQRFLRAETYARVKGRPDKRQAMAVVIGMDGRPAPLLEEFDIADSDRAAVNDLIERVAAALEEADTSRRSIILAALAELSHALHAKTPARAKKRERQSGFMTTDSVKHVLGLSGGRDSAALAVYMRQHHPELHIEYFFTDTGKELPEVYEYLGNLEGFLGQPIRRLNPDRDFDFWLRQYNDFLPSPQSRWCTRQLKLRPFEHWLRPMLSDGTTIYSYVAIRSDEQYREGYSSKHNGLVIKLPFKQDGIDKAGVLDILNDAGLGLPKYYAWRTRSGCTFCFFQQKIEWVRLKEQHPGGVRGSQGVREERRRTRIAVHVEQGGVT